MAVNDCCLSCRETLFVRECFRGSSADPVSRGSNGIASLYLVQVRLGNGWLSPIFGQCRTEASGDGHEAGFVEVGQTPRPHPERRRDGSAHSELTAVKH